MNIEELYEMREHCDFAIRHGHFMPQTDNTAIKILIDDAIARDTVTNKDVQVAIDHIASRKDNPVNMGCECPSCKAYRVIVTAALRAYRPEPVGEDAEATLAEVKKLFEKLRYSLCYSLCSCNDSECVEMREVVRKLEELLEVNRQMKGE